MTDQPANLDSTGGAQPDAEPCEDCASGTGRAVLLAFAFAAFAAWVAADFATGGALTRWAVGTLAALRGRGDETG